jgi:hypothetical protein
MFNKNILKFTQFYHKYKFLVNLTSLILAIITLLWLIIILAFSFFIDLDNALKTRSPFPLKYVGYDLEYSSFLPTIVLDRVTIDAPLGELISNKATIKLNLFSLLTSSGQIAQILFNDSNLNINKNNEIGILNHQQHIQNILNQKNNLFDISFSNITVNLPNKEINFSNTTIQNSSNKFLLKCLADEDIDILLEIEKNDPNNTLTLSATDKSKNLTIKGIYLGSKFQSGNIIYTNTDFNTTITSDLVLDKNNMSLKNIICKGESIEGSGSLDLIDKNLSFVADLKHVNVNNILSIPTIKRTLEQKEDEKIFPSNFDVNIQVKLGSLVFAKQTLNNINFSLHTNNDGTFAVDDLSANFDNNGSFKIIGEITNNHYRSIFSGAISLAHNDTNMLLTKLGIETTEDTIAKPLSLASKISLTGVELNAEDLDCNIGNHNLSGNLTYKTIGDNPRLNGSIKIKSFNSKDTLPIFSRAFEYFNSIIFDSYKKDYLNNFIPIRTNDILINLNLEAADTSLENSYYDKINLLVNTTPGKIDINAFSISNQDNYLAGDASLDASNFQPIYKINILEGKLPNLDFGNFLLDLRNSLQQHFDFEDITGTLAINLKELNVSSTDIKNFSLTASNNHSALVIDNLSFEALGGKSQINGRITQKPFLVSLGYAYNNLNLAPIFDLSVLLNNTTGLISTSGVINFGGDSLAEMLYSLNVKADILGQDITVHNFGIDNLIGSTSKKDFQNSSAYFDDFVNNGTTKFNNVKGSYKMQNGILSLNNISFLTNKSSGALSADIDIYKQTINLSSLLNFNATDKADKISQFKINMVDSIFNPIKTVEFTKDLSSNSHDH